MKNGKEKSEDITVESRGSRHRSMLPIFLTQRRVLVQDEDCSIRGAASSSEMSTGPPFARVFLLTLKVIRTMSWADVQAEFVLWWKDALREEATARSDSQASVKIGTVMGSTMTIPVCGKSSRFLRHDGKDISRDVVLIF